MTDSQDAAPIARMPEQEAISMVRRHILRQGYDTTGYPLSRLRADRFSVGWLVYVPTRPGELAVDRALFYVGDDGELEHATSAIAPSRYMAEFEKRFHARHGVSGD